MRKGEGAPDYVFDVVSVNGNTWPKLQVAQDRYRFRLLNGSALRETMGLYMAYKNANGQQTEVPFYVIGSDQGMLPQVAVVKRSHSSIIDGCGNEKIMTSRNFGLILSPGERIDVIVDFSNLPDGTIVDLNIANPFDVFLPPGIKNPLTLPEQAMRFIVTQNLCDKTPGATLNSTSPLKLTLLPLQDVGGVTLSKPRDIAMRFENPTIFHKPLFSDGPRAVGVGKDSTPLLWSSPITQNPEINAVEIWVRSLNKSCFSSSLISNRLVICNVSHFNFYHKEFWNYMPVFHPMHVHLVKFQVLERCPFNPTADPVGDVALSNCVQPEVWETGFKDTVLCYPGDVCRIKMKFDGKGLYMFHCHFLVHEDDEMMRPFCIGEIGKDCAADLF
jgi:FtsP/CotA-like multicopper oxidase with cupredoxin domain